MNGARIRTMLPTDIDGVLQVELNCFAVPWSRVAFENEINDNDLAHYLVIEAGDRIIGYAGMWMILDEAHVTNIAVISGDRRQGLGERLLLALIGQARQLGAVSMTLEVRPSNTAAQVLYRKLGFENRGIRRQYYSDTKEDAIIMWRDGLDTAGADPLAKA